MLRITMNNVTKMSEDALYIALEALPEKDPMYPVIESELDRRGELYNQMLAKKHSAQLESLKVTQAIQAEIAAIFEGCKGQKTLRLIENFGQEMIEDYTICEVSFTVTSKVSHAVFNNPSTWECETLEVANRKKARLIYYRIYDKFMRDATIDNLELLKRVLG